MSRKEDLRCATTGGAEVFVAPPVEEDPICVTLSERDADRLLEILNDPPPPNDVARQAAERYKQKYGH